MLPPWFLITSIHLFGILLIHFSMASLSILFHSSRTTSCRLWYVWTRGIRLSMARLSVCQMFLIGLKSGDCEGQSRTVTLCSLKKFVVGLAVCIEVSNVPSVSDKGMPVQIVPYLISCWYKIKLCSQHCYFDTTTGYHKSINICIFLLV
jgi:hypothetical protein